MKFARVVYFLFVTGGLMSVCYGQNTNDPAPFAGEIAAFEIIDQKSFPPENAIVITGSSSIRRWDSIVEDLNPLTIIPRGFGGSTMADLLLYLDRIVLNYKPRAVVIYEGDNDTARGVSPQEVAQQFTAGIKRIHDAYPDTRIYLISVKPSILRWEMWKEAQATNELLQDIANADERIMYIDAASALLDQNGVVMQDIFVEDDLHFNDKGTHLWASVIRAVLIANEASFE